MIIFNKFTLKARMTNIQNTCLVSLTDRLKYQVSYLLDAKWYEKSPQNISVYIS